MFQSFHLIPTMTALENVALPLELAGDADDAFARAERELRAVGLGERLHHYPAQLSGGEQQRVAIARAIAPNPAILVADEPTGNLDEATGDAIIDLLFALQRERGATLVLVTHDLALAPSAATASCACAPATSRRTPTQRRPEARAHARCPPRLAAASGGPRSLPLTLRLALRELRGGLRGFGIFLACIALGVAAIAGVASIARSLTEGLAAGRPHDSRRRHGLFADPREANAGERDFLDGARKGVVDRLHARHGDGRRQRLGARRDQGRRCGLSGRRRARDRSAA